MWLREFTASEFVTVNKQLNPKIWQKNELDSVVADKLKEIALAFKEFVGIDLEVIDYTITGSNANYTWTAYSDLDLHLIVKGAPNAAARELFNAKKALWAEQHNITVRGMPVECYVQGEDEPHHSTGVYSIVKQSWIKEPGKVKPKIDDAAVAAKKESLVHDIETAILSKNLSKLRTVKERVTNMRKAGLERAGEWSTENLAFKLLRNLGLIDQINDLVRELEDQELSLEQAQSMR
jgi:hypothetical protein